jgi:hypothetical protein
MGARRQYHERHRKRGDASNLDHAKERRLHSARVTAGHQQHHYGRECHEAQARIDGCEQSQWRDGEHEETYERDLAGVGNQGHNNADINGAADGARKVVHGRLQRPAEAHLCEDDCGQHCPQREDAASQRA